MECWSNRIGGGPVHQYLENALKWLYPGAQQLLTHNCSGELFVCRLPLEKKTILVQAMTELSSHQHCKCIHILHHTRKKIFLPNSLLAYSFDIHSHFRNWINCVLFCELLRNALKSTGTLVLGPPMQYGADCLLRVLSNDLMLFS